MLGATRVYRWSRLLPALFVLLTGCASIPPSVSELPETARAIELEDTPFYPQERYQCGPAALTTVLVQSGAGASLEAIVDKVYLPGRQGSLQVELLAATRTEGRLPYVIDGDGKVAQRRPEERGVTELVASALSKGRAGLSELVGNGLPRELSDHAPINDVSALR